MILATAFPAGYDSSVAAKSAAGIGVPNPKADTPPPVRFFCVRSMASLSMGGPCRALRGAGFLWSGTPTCTVPLSPIGVREADSITASKGQFAMTYRNPLSSSARARAHRARHRRLGHAGRREHDRRGRRRQHQQRHRLRRGALQRAAPREPARRARPRGARQRRLRLAVLRVVPRRARAARHRPGVPFPRRGIEPRLGTRPHTHTHHTHTHTHIYMIASFSA